MADLIGIGKNNGKVVGIDIYKSFVNMTITNLNKFPFLQEQINFGNIEIICGNGWEGCEKSAPYHVIHVGAMVDHIPEKLFNQLEIGGAIILPMRGQYHVIEKTMENKQNVFVLSGVRFVNLLKVNEIDKKKIKFERIISDSMCILDD